MDFAPRPPTDAARPGGGPAADRTHRRRRGEWISGCGAAVAALFLIGTSAPVAARLGDYPLLGGQAVRFAVAAVVLLALLPAAGGAAPSRPTVRDLAGSAVLGLVGIAGFNVFLVAAARAADPTLVGTVLAVAPIALAVLGPAMRRHRPSPTVAAGCVIVAVGTVAATGSGGSGASGALLCLGALVCEIAFSLLAVPLIDRLGTLRTTAYAVTAAALLLAAASLSAEGAAGLLRTPTATELACLLYLALVIAVAANLLWYAALPRIGADHAGLFYAFTPIGALTAGLLLHTSTPTASGLVGLVLTVTGLLVGLAPAPVRRRRRAGRATARPTPAPPDRSGPARPRSPGSGVQRC
ncbi:drug/metabolite transporter (DMT)-like permease [Spinactinospora alkalitolerans]|uniref:Drug/metabolite transporter (DMT)-like permease n=1 Tax=Spinactinospora alkalitolerans TaxID=687207 RepID=A0A852TZ41_9ACTN|nr:DMT family transporter [Spinactinospora alkalitolerans]NYE47070.1 drug/metabolite transporter (DMT)-like permease [Spinactinospora alkalitolerans]